MRNILVVGGASDHKGELAAVVKDVLGEDPCVVLRSLNRKHTERTLEGFFSTVWAGDTTFIICKSQGAWRVLAWLKKNYKRLKDSAISVLSIDPHPWQNEWMKFFGTFRKPVAVFPTWNIYQRNAWPKGTEVKGAILNRCLKAPSVSHWNIIKQNYVRLVIEYEGRRCR